jgi:predicted MFS family arabinose efflux permease
MLALSAAALVTIPLALPLRGGGDRHSSFPSGLLATLFGLTLLTRQVGGFLGAWLGGLAMEQSGNYQWMWYADIALASFASVVNLPIRAPVKVG